MPIYKLREREGVATYARDRDSTNNADACDGSVDTCRGTGSRFSSHANRVDTKGCAGCLRLWRATTTF